MTREKAIGIFERLRDAQVAQADEIEAVLHFDSSFRMLAELYDMALAALREQETLTQSQNSLTQWISVADRLPTEGERVLATDGAFVGEMYINKRGKWQRYNVNDSSLLMALDILWWMPMPPAPKEEV